MANKVKIVATISYFIKLLGAVSWLYSLGPNQLDYMLILP